MWKTASNVSYIGIFFGVAIAISYFAGRWVDHRLHTDPWFSIGGVLVGVAAGFRELIRIGRRYQRDENSEDEQKKD